VLDSFSMKTPEEILEDFSDWPLLCTFLPSGWIGQARASGALRRARGVANAEKLLRVLMIHLAAGCSLKETSVRARQAGLAELSAVALHKCLKASEEWLRRLAQGLLISRSSQLPELGRRVVAVDATTVSEPGSTGTDWRLHYAVSVADLQCLFFEITGVGGGETWRRFPMRRGDILMGDRVYSTTSGVARVVKQGADVVVQMRVQGFPLVDGRGARLPLLEQVKGLRVGRILDRPAAALGPGQKPVPGRLIAVKRSREAARRQRKRQARAASKKGEKVSPQAYRAAAYFLLWTSLGQEVPPQTVLTLYRLRWQIELVFKRLKSILGLGHLPKKDPASCRAWLHGKLLVALLVERMIHEFDSFSPWGYPVAGPAQPVARNRLSSA